MLEILDQFCIEMINHLSNFQEITNQTKKMKNEGLLKKEEKSIQ